MPITYNNLFDNIISFENLYGAFQDTIAHGRKERPDALAFRFHAEKNIADIHDALTSGTWRPSPYHRFLCRSEVKRRVIDAPTIGDRIVHMAIYRVLYPLLDRKYIYDSYACRKGKGCSQAVARVQDFLRRQKRQTGSAYVLQGDISKFYPSIYKPYLLEKLGRTVRDKRLLELLETIYYDYNGSDRGVPIGAATSQLAANIVLDTLDHFAKETLGIRYYVRYMDDFIVIAGDKSQLWAWLREINWLVTAVLKLRLNPKTRVFASSQGVDFCGYRTWATHILPRKRNVKAAKQRFKKLSAAFAAGEIDVADVRQSVASFRGYMSHCDGYDTTVHVLRNFVLRRNHE